MIEDIEKLSSILGPYGATAVCLIAVIGGGWIGIVIGTWLSSLHLKRGR